MTDFNLVLSQVRQRLEILYQIVDELEAQGGGGGGTTDYTDLDNKPKINNVTLSGNKSSSDLGLASAAALDDKADKSTTYTKLETDSKITSDIVGVINDLDVSAVGGSTKYITTISEANGLIEATAELSDTAPTANSDKLCRSGGIKTYVDNGVNPLKNALSTIIDETYKVNVLQNTGTTATIGNEVEFTVNSNGSITATVIATTTAQRNFDFVSTVPAGTWWFSTNQPLSGGTTDNPCYCAINKSGTALCNDFNPEKQTLVVAETANYQFRTVIRNGVPQGTVLTFYPMLCKPEWYAVSPTFVPYVATSALTSLSIPDDMRSVNEIEEPEIIEPDER